MQRKFLACRRAAIPPPFLEIDMIRCSSCKEEKDASFFHKDATTKTGCSSYCKSCKKSKDQIYTKNTSYTNRKEHKAEWRKQFPERKSAHIKIYHALKKGILFKQPCFMCGENAEAHHPDYSRPLDVVWLCSSHHRQAHMNF